MTSPFPLTGYPGKTVLITGASSGIGRATAIEMARRGAQVVINYPHPGERAAAEQTLRRVREAAFAAPPVLAGLEFAEPQFVPADPGGDGAASLPAALLVEADVSDAGAVARLFSEVLGELGRLDVLVNNAGIQFEDEHSHSGDIDLFDRVLATNLRGPYLCAREALRHWVETGTRGSIVNVSSVHEQIPRPHYASYAASKFGLRGLTQTLALEYAERGIRINSVGPGATLTPIQGWLGDPLQQAVVESHIPMKRVASPEEIARTIAWVGSDDAPYMTGQTVFVDGGLTLYPAFAEPWSG